MNTLATYSSELDYAKLPKIVKDEVDKWCRAIREVMTTKPRMTAYQRAAEYLGVSADAVRGKFARYCQEGHNWRVFIDARKMPHDEQKLPEEFLEWYLISLCGGNQRKNRPAHSKLIKLWMMKQPIPGYPTLPPSYPGTDMPWGWTYSNLQKAIKKNPRCQFLLTLCRQGTVAASALMPNLCLSTRIGIKPGQIYMPDDRWVDAEVIVSGQPEPCRPIELGIGDFASTKKCCWGIKPQLRLTRKGKRSRTKDTDMRLLYAQLFCLVGYHRDGVTIICESGTAGMPVDLELELCRLTGGEVIDGKIVKEGLIRIQRSSFQGGTRLMGGYLGKRLGNFKTKASYESSHALYHNESADLPGQTGHAAGTDISGTAPEDQANRNNSAAKLMTAMLAIRPELREQLKFGSHLHFKAFLQVYMQLKDRIEDRKKHRIQDWEDCGYIVEEYRTSFDPEGWRPRSELATFPPLRRQQIEQLINAQPTLLKRTRRMSPNEVWARGQGELTVLPIHCMRLILGEKLMEPRYVQKNGEFIFRVPDIGDRPLHFVAIATDDHGKETVLIPGREYRTWLNDFNPDMLFVEELGGPGHGRYLGICRPVNVASPTDQQGRIDAVRAGQKRLNVAMAPYLAQGTKLLADRAKELNGNAEVFENAHLTEADKRLARDRAQRAASADRSTALPLLSSVPADTAVPDDEEPPDFSNLA